MKHRARHPAEFPNQLAPQHLPGAAGRLKLRHDGGMSTATRYGEDKCLLEA
jgi:hypothetical protein